MKVQLIRLFCAGFGSSIAAKLYHYFSKLSVGDVMALILSTALAIILYKLLEYILVELPLKISKFRYLVEPKALVEGNWLQIKKKSQFLTYSFITIVYNHDSKDFLVSGQSYDPQGKVGAMWKSTHCFIDLRTDLVKYFYKAELHYDGDNSVSEGYTVMNLIKNRKGSYQRGMGYFVDSDGRRCKFSLEKINSSDLNDSIGKKYIEVNSDIKNFIREYHKNRSEDTFTDIPKSDKTAF